MNVYHCQSYHNNKLFILRKLLNLDRRVDLWLCLGFRYVLFILTTTALIVRGTLVWQRFEFIIYIKEFSSF